MSLQKALLHTVKTAILLLSFVESSMWMLGVVLLRCVCVCVCVFTDPAPVLEASHTLEERLQHLHSKAPDSEALVREISGHWKRHLECLQQTGEGQSSAQYHFKSSILGLNHHQIQT